MGSLDHWQRTFNAVGWFIPPYIQMRALGRIAAEINAREDQYGQNDLEEALAMPMSSDGHLQKWSETVARRLAR